MLSNILSRFLLLLSLLSTGTVILAQQQGTITYERKTDMRRHVEDEQMKAMVPPFQIGQYNLFYRDSLCVYKAIPKDEAPDPFDNPSGHDGTSIRIEFRGPGDGGILWRNLSGSQSLEQTTLADVEYVITDSIHSLPWKLNTDTVTILGHLCKKATAISPRNKISIIAWYCEDIPLPIGPDKFDGLPGAILKIDMDNGFNTFTATKITVAADPKNLKAPTGKFITRANFEKKMDEVLGPADSQGRRMIRN
jgi:GLPGLI family protein